MDIAMRPDCAIVSNDDCCMGEVASFVPRTAAVNVLAQVDYIQEKLSLAGKCAKCRAAQLCSGTT